MKIKWILLFATIICFVASAHRAWLDYQTVMTSFPFYLRIIGISIECLPLAALCAYTFFRNK